MHIECKFTAVPHKNAAISNDKSQLTISWKEHSLYIIITQWFKLPHYDNQQQSMGRFSYANDGPKLQNQQYLSSLFLTWLLFIYVTK